MLRVMKNSYLGIRIALTFILCCLIGYEVFSQPFVEQTGIQFSDSSGKDFDWGDYDNDGDLDFLIAGSKGAKIYRNDGNNDFVEQTEIKLYKEGVSSVQWGVFNNDDYLDILLATKPKDFEQKFIIFKNNDAHTFLDSILIGINDDASGLHPSDVNWVDYDRDGYLDVYVCDDGQLFRNNGNDSFSKQTDVVIYNQHGTSAWADYDNDGDMDVLTGHPYQTGTLWLYRNNGNNDFSQNHCFSSVCYYVSTNAWGDYDNDGDLDILFSGISGIAENSGTYTWIYCNNGDGTFSQQTKIALPGKFSYGSLAWGDYDNDGKLDIVITGTDINNVTSLKVFKNNGNNTFSELTGLSATGTIRGRVAWVDYDNDGDLDFTVCGTTESINVVKFYRNERIQNKNIVPNVISGLTSSVQNADVKLQWDEGTDDNTPGKALTYNVIVWTTTGDNNPLSSHSNISDGYRKIIAYGNAQSNQFLPLKNLKKGTYFWSVQAIDHHFAGGTFAPENQFTISANSQASDLTILSVGGLRGKIKWNRGNLDSCIVFIKQETGSDHAQPVNNDIYTGIPDYGKGSSIGTSEWYCLYKGVDNNVDISGLLPQTTYRVEIFEFESTAGYPTYFTDISNSNSIEFTTPSYTRMVVQDFFGMDLGDLAFGDMDNDNDLDIIETGYDYLCSWSAFYRNDSKNDFHYLNPLPLFAHNSSVDLGDYDQDGDLDILISGCQEYNQTVLKTSVLDNSGSGNFIQRQDIVLPGLNYSAVAWGDYDNDGNLDILISGFTGSKRITEIYQNCGNHVFTRQENIFLHGVSDGSLAWGDYDNDNDIDILLTGDDGTKPISKIYRNNGNGTFTGLINLSLPGVKKSAVAWADYNSDGYLDFVLTGHDGIEPVSLIFRNTGEGTFTQLTDNTLIGVYDSDVACGDYDADGDMDILLAGKTSDGNITSLYINIGDDKFVVQSDFEMSDLSGCSVAFGDSDNDGDLDIINNGKEYKIDEINHIFKFFRNDQITYENEPPEAPCNLNSITDSGALLQWDMATDDHSAMESLTYNIMLDSVPGGISIVSPQSDLVSGFHYVAKMGNAQTGNSFRIESMKKGTYYWRVQAIDNSFIGGPWSEEASFSVNACLHASPDTIYVPGIAERRSSFNIVANVDWKIVADQNWFSTHDSSGFGNQNIRINADEWNEEKDREASIFITSAETDTVKIILVQSATYISKVKNKLAENIHVYPNPVSDILYIKGINNQDVMIYSLQGNLLLSERIKDNPGFINVSSLPKGCYILRIEDKVAKIVKN